MPSEYSLANRAEAGNGLLRACIARVRLEGDADGAKSLESMADEQVGGLSPNACMPVLRGQPDPAQLQSAMTRLDIDVAHAADGPPVLAKHNGKGKSLTGCLLI
jgi:hypothetical protein